MIDIAVFTENKAKMNSTKISIHREEYDLTNLDEDYTLSTPINVSVIMLNRRTALLQWWPREALMHQDVEIVFTPEYSK